MLPGLWVGDHGADGLIAFVALLWVGGCERVFELISGLGDQLGGGTTLGFIAVKQGLLSSAVMD